MFENLILVIKIANIVVPIVIFFLALKKNNNKATLVMRVFLAFLLVVINIPLAMLENSWAWFLVGLWTLSFVFHLLALGFTGDHE